MEMSSTVAKNTFIILHPQVNLTRINHSLNHLYLLQCCSTSIFALRLLMFTFYLLALIKKKHSISSLLSMIFPNIRKCTFLQ